MLLSSVVFLSWAPFVVALPREVIQPTAALVAPRAVVTPPPCVAIAPPPTEDETRKRHEIFANAFLVAKNLTNAFEYISSTYIVGLSSKLFHIVS